MLWEFTKKQHSLFYRPKSRKQGIEFYPFTGPRDLLMRVRQEKYLAHIVYFGLFLIHIVWPT